MTRQVNDNLTTPLRLASIRVEGAVRTRQSFLSSLVTPFLPHYAASPFASSADSLGDVLHKARHIGALLQETDIFQTVDARLEGSRDFLARPGDVDLVFRTRERGRFYLNTSTQVGNNEGGAVSPESWSCVQELRYVEERDMSYTKRARRCGALPG